MHPGLFKNGWQQTTDQAQSQTGARIAAESGIYDHIYYLFWLKLFPLNSQRTKVAASFMNLLFGKLTTSHQCSIACCAPPRFTPLTCIQITTPESDPVTDLSRNMSQGCIHLLVFRGGQENSKQAATLFNYNDSIPVRRFYLYICIYIYISLSLSQLSPPSIAISEVQRQHVNMV